MGCDFYDVEVLEIWYKLGIKEHMKIVELQRLKMNDVGYDYFIAEERKIIFDGGWQNNEYRDIIEENLPVIIKGDPVIRGKLIYASKYNIMQPRV